ncbi:uncharacterized protein LOC111880831 [Lactuca sativa]|uniref:DUF7392 domain-containing protein n=1 Tax=Lactuca sativa TaxID=4236 RepID=A0A9R1V4R9_LACSA|nr:uncharacterized protein LOC111880831 [Lactuca sativa]KAJ0198248.1 hypothetical protein LSAT_V11C700353510 [Lactuca sativa]
MACFMPFTNKNLDIFICVLRPTVAIIDDLVDTLKQFSFFTERLGCIHSSIFNSIHGNMIIWYGAWIKRSDENKELLHEALLLALTNLQSMAVLLDHDFMVAYGGEVRDGSPAAKFSTGDIVCFNTIHLLSDTKMNKMNEQDFVYTCFSVFQSYFHKMNGTVAGVCLKYESISTVINFYVWKNLQSCYSFALNSDNREILQNCFHDATVFMKYDVFKVVYVSADDVSSFQYYPPHKLLENQALEVVKDFE